MGVVVREKISDSGVWWVFINHKGFRTSKKIGSKRNAISIAKKIKEKLIIDDLANKLTFNNTDKQKYREFVYSFANRNSILSIKDRKVIFLESEEAAETAHLLNKGYSIKNIFPCNSNPLIALHAKKNINSGKLKFKVGNIFEQINKTHDIINIDTCGPINKSLLKNVKHILKNKTSKDVIISINIYRGRESEDWFHERSAALSLQNLPTGKYTKSDIVRLAMLKKELYRPTKPKDFDYYFYGHMLTVIAAY